MDADQPSYPLHTLTAVQLRDYRRELEHSLEVLAPDAPVRNLLASRLFEVLGEQASRPSAELADPAMLGGEEETGSNS